MADAKPAPVKHEPPAELPPTNQTQQFKGRVKRTPEEQAEYFYNLRTMHIVFFLSSLVLLVLLVGSMLQDWDRDWKHYQRAYRAMEMTRLQSELAEIDEQFHGKQGEMRRLDSEIRRLERAQDESFLEIPKLDPRTGLPQKGGDGLPVLEKATYPELKELRRQLAGEHYLKQQRMNFEKSDYMTFRWRFEEAKHHFEEALKAGGARLAAYEAVYARERRAFEEIVKKRDEATAQFQAVDARMTQIEDAIIALEKPYKDAVAARDKLIKEATDRLRRIKREMPQWSSDVRDAPGLDFFDPTVRIQQVSVSDVLQNMNFVHVERVDRCHTCHVGIGNPGYEIRSEEGEHGAAPVFKQEHLREFVEHATGHTPADQCRICARAGKPIPYPEGEDKVLGFEGVPHQSWTSEDAAKFTKALAAHPRLDLYVSTSSPHPMSKFGCTVCHEGDGRETDFSRAVHFPSDEHQEKLWKSRHHWEYRELWDEPMLPQKHVYASCRKCHSRDVDLPNSGDYLTGMKLYERAGCYACHRTDSYQILPKDHETLAAQGDASRIYRRPGPPLTHVADKTTKEWAFRWILNPKAFRLTTTMPRFFGQTNARRVTGTDGKKYPPEEVDAAQAACIVEFLFQRSESRDYSKLPAPGLPASADRGRQLFDQVGCTACHTTKPDSEYAKRQDIRNADDIYRAPDGASWYLEEFGPNLSGMGSKTHRAWLTAWLKDPKHYFADTRMGSFRLTDQEASDLAEYLLSLKKPADDAQPKLAPPPAPLLDALLIEKMAGQRSLEDVQAEIKSWSPEKKVFEYGRKMVQNYGCYSCHEMRPEEKGERPDAVDWRNSEGIGVELTGAQPWGRKAVDRLAFGYAEYEPPNYRGVSFRHPITDQPYRQVGGHGGNPEIVRVHKTRHDWGFNKLLNPRVFDGGKEASTPPDELLKMPNFYFTPEEAKALMTFVLSFKDDEVHGLLEKIKTRPTPEQQAIQRGQRLLRESNCKACHRLELDRLLVEWQRTETTADGREKQVVSNVWIEGRRQLELKPEQARAQLARLGIAPRPAERLLALKWVTDPCTLQMPAVVNEDATYVYFDGTDWWYLDAQQDALTAKRRILEVRPMHGGDIIPKIEAVKRAQADEVWIDKGNPASFETRLPPMLRTQGNKTQAEWLYAFLKAPYPIRPALNPVLPDVSGIAPPGAEDRKKILALAAKLADEDPDIADEASEELDELGKEAWPVLVEAFLGSSSTAQRARLMDLLKMSAHADVSIRMPTFGFTDEEASSLVRYFWVRDQLRGTDVYPHTSFPERNENYLNGRSGLIAEVQKTVVEKDCVACHFYDGKPAPGGQLYATKFGPDFNQMPDRLRPRWLYRWLEDPSSVYPGTSMTAYTYPSPDHLRATAEFILNFRRLKQSGN